MKLDSKEKIYTFATMSILLIVVVSLIFFYKKNINISELPLLIINITVIPFLIISFIYKRR